MDVIKDGKVLGSTDGVLVNNPNFVPGKVRNALSFSGIDQAVHLGMHASECFHSPEMCISESTFVYWLKWEPLTRVGLILETGGWFGFSHGYSHQINSDGTMIILAKDYETYYDLKTFVGNPNQWLFIVITWSPSVGIKLYVNGCPFGDDVVTANIRPRIHTLVRNQQFVIGEPSSGSPHRANMTLDNLVAWDEEIHADEVWQLYVQAGQI